MSQRPWTRPGAGVLAALWGFLLPGPVVTARTVLLTGDPIVVRLQALQPTALTFPEPLTAVPTGADPKHLSLELDGPRLFLQPLEAKVQGVLFAVGVSGRSYPVRFTVGTPADTEVVLVLPAATAPQGVAGAAAPAAPPAGVTVRALLAALLTRTPVPGATEAADRQVLLATDRLRLTTTRVVLAGPLVGYLAEAQNLTDQPLPLLLPEYYAPGLKALTAGAEVLPPKGRTPVVLVFQPGSPH
jgi:hypothetical protein